MDKACCACARDDAPNVRIGETGKHMCPRCAVALADKVFTLDEAAIEQLWLVTHGPSDTSDGPASADEAEAHADLAVAYLELGHPAFALESALRSLRVAPTKPALGVVFDERLRKASVQRIVALIQPN